MTALAIYILMHACAVAPSDRADRWMDKLLASKQAMGDAWYKRWDELEIGASESERFNIAQERTGKGSLMQTPEWQATDAMFQRCINDVLRGSQAKMDSAIKGLQAVIDDTNAAIARDARRRRIVRRILRLGIP